MKKVNQRLYLKVPQFEELWYRKQLLGDPKTMEFNKGLDDQTNNYNYENGTIDFDEVQWDDFYKEWIVNNKNNFYAYIVRKEDGKFLGETFFVFDDENERYDSRILLEKSARKLGYANEIVDQLIMEAFDKGMPAFYTTIKRDRFDSEFYKKRNFKEIRPGKTLMKDGEEIETVLIGVDKNDYMKYMYGNSIKWNFKQVFRKIFA